MTQLFKSPAGRIPVITFLLNCKKTGACEDILDVFARFATDPDEVHADGNSALHFACEHYKRLGTTSPLLGRGARCDCTYRSGETPLHKAAICLGLPGVELAKIYHLRKAFKSQSQ